MSVLKYFKTTPWSPPTGRQTLSVIFFLQICNEVPEKKGACRPLGGRQGPLPLIHRMPSFRLSFEPKNLGKKPALAGIPFVI